MQKKYRGCLLKSEPLNGHRLRYGWKGEWEQRKEYENESNTLYFVCKQQIE